jgi:hypothetical protein
MSVLRLLGAGMLGGQRIFDIQSRPGPEIEIHETEN